MSSTSSTAHRRDFCRALYLQPSPEKLGRADLNVHISLVPNETITNCILTPSDKKLGRAGGKVYSVKSLRLFLRLLGRLGRLRKLRVVIVIKEMLLIEASISLNSLNSLIKVKAKL